MPDEAEIVSRRFRIERGAEGEVERVYVEGLNAKGRRHWFLVWAGDQPGRPQDLSWLDVSRLLWIDLEKRPSSTRSITSAGVFGDASKQQGWRRP
jgi:hypothetical protein